MKYLKRTIICLVVLIPLISCDSGRNNKVIRPGEVWYDTEGQPINAHGGGILYNDGTYYWYGEYKQGETRRLAHIKDWECNRVDASGISCYSSTDLLNWKYEGIVLPAEKKDSTHDLHFTRVIERPKVIYNEASGKYVMWMHVDSDDYLYARAGVAVADSPGGPFTYLGSVRPYGQMSRDMTLFKDRDGRAYHVFSSENNETMYVSLLNPDYLGHSERYTRIFIGASREAPAIIAQEDRYYMVTSACTGWDPNEAEYAVSDSLLGNWKVMGNPCCGEGKETTFMSQSTFLLPLEGKQGQFIFMADRWEKTNLEDSRYVWLPGEITGNKMQIQWQDQWIPSFNQPFFAQLSLRPTVRLNTSFSSLVSGSRLK